MSQFKALLIVLYITGSTVTYGHAYQFNDHQTVDSFNGKRREADSASRGLLALASSIVWPYYWSQHYWSKP